MPGPVRTNGMSSAAAAMQMLERKQQVLANNLANASTRGFKAETAFARLMDNQLAKTDTALDLTAGSLTETHNTLDLVGRRLAPAAHTRDDHGLFARHWVTGAAWRQTKTLPLPAVAPAR